MDQAERQIIAWLCILVGSYFMAKSAVSRRDRGQMRELLGLPLDKVKRFRDFFVQRLERIVGFTFVLIGVAIHLYVVVRLHQRTSGANDPRAALAHISTYLAIAIVAMLVITAAMHYICSYFARKIFLDILGYLMVRQRYRLGDDPRLMKQIGEMLGVAHEDSDTVESYTQRIEDALKLDTIRADLLRLGKLPDLDAPGGTREPPGR